MRSWRFYIQLIDSAFPQINRQVRLSYSDDIESNIKINLLTVGHYHSFCSLAVCSFSSKEEKAFYNT